MRPAAHSNEPRVSRLLSTPEDENWESTPKSFPCRAALHLNPAAHLAWMRRVAQLEDSFLLSA